MVLLLVFGEKGGREKERERESLAKEKGGRWLESVRREGTLRLLLS